MGKDVLYPAGLPGLAWQRGSAPHGYGTTVREPGGDANKRQSKLGSRLVSSLITSRISDGCNTHQHVLLCFLSSQMRWTLTTPSSIQCPLCHKDSWLWEQFFSCSVITPALRSRSLNVTSFKHSVIDSRWKEVFYTVANVLLVWHLAISMSCNWLKLEYDLDTFHSVLSASSTLTR